MVPWNRPCLSYRVVNTCARSYHGKLRAIQVDKNDPDFRASRIFVSGIPLNVDWMMLKDHFKKSFPDVVYASVSIDTVTGKSKGCGVLQLPSKSEADRAVREMSGSILLGSTLFVRKDVQERKADPFPRDTVRPVVSNQLKQKVKSREEHINDRWKKRATKDTEIKDKTLISKEEFLKIPYSFDKSSESELSSLVSGDAEARGNLILKVQELVEQRESFRKEKNFEEADEIRTILLKEYRVSCDDSKRKWRILAPK